MDKATVVVFFDKKNQQKDYQWIARDLVNNKLTIGYIVVEKPWYSFRLNWTFWMYSNDYASGGFCGGAIDKDLKRYAVKEETIKPFTQIEEIKYYLETGFIVELRDHDNPSFNYFFEKESDIPYELWSD